MRKRMRITFTMLSIATIILLIYLSLSWVILPTESTPRKLTLVSNGGPHMKQITLKHYVNNVHISDYVLELKIGVWHQMPHVYELPQLNDGMIEVIVEAKDGGDGHNISLVLEYENAYDLYEKGLLIYLTESYDSIANIDGFVYSDQYVYFITGKNETCYFAKADLNEWSLITKAPPPKRFVRQEKTYSSFYYGWKENKWVKR